MFRKMEISIDAKMIIYLQKKTKEVMHECQCLKVILGSFTEG